MYLAMVHRCGEVELLIEGDYDPGRPGTLLDRIVLGRVTAVRPANGEADLLTLLSEEAADEIRKALAAEVAADGHEPLDPDARLDAQLMARGE